MKCLLLTSLAALALVAGCEQATESGAPATQLLLSATDLRGTWEFADVQPTRGFGSEADSFALLWSRDRYVGNAQVRLLAEGQPLHWRFRKPPVFLFSPDPADTAFTSGTYVVRHAGAATWLDLDNCDTEHLRVRLAPDRTLRAEDPKYHIELTMRRVD